MEKQPITASLTAIGARVAQLSRGRLLVATRNGATVFREDGTIDPVQPVRSPPDPPPAGSET
jgi:hypothetical protein